MFSVHSLHAEPIELLMGLRRRMSDSGFHVTTFPACVVVVQQLPTLVVT